MLLSHPALQFTFLFMYLNLHHLLLQRSQSGVIVSGGTSVIADSSKSTTAASSVVEKSSITTVASPKTPTTVALNSPQPVVKLVKLSTPTTITTSCDITNNQEQIVEKAKQVTDFQFCLAV